MSKNQWIGLACLLLIVVALELCAYLTRRRAEQQSLPELLTMQPECEEAFLAYLDSLSQAHYAERRAQYSRKRNTIPICLQPFDPNTADSTLLVTVGMKPWMAHNLLRYRQAGKVFRKKEELRSLYGLNDSLYATLEPYIQIDSVVSGGKGGENAGLVLSNTYPKRDTVLELNTADTTELMLLRGVGRYTAIQIIKYRNDLGGYYAAEQLYEIREIPAERVDSLIPHLYADTARIEPIQVNHASIRRLQRHPYISYRQAEQVYDLRRSKIRLRSMSELAGIFTEDEQQKLRPYMLFE